MDDPTTSGVTEGFGLMFYQSRFYDPALGRFTQPDTLIPDEHNSQSWDIFAYVGNNPCRSSDPDGHCWPICTMLAGAVVGAAVSAGTYWALNTVMGREVTTGGLVGAAVSGAITGAVAGVAGPVAGTVMATAGIQVTAGSLAIGTAVLNGVVGAEAYVAGTTTQNLIDVPNGEQPVPITAGGMLTAGLANGVGSLLVSNINPPVSQNSIAQAASFAPGRTWNTVFSQGAIYSGVDIAAGAAIGTTSALYQPTPDSNCNYDNTGLLCFPVQQPSASTITTIGAP